MEGHVVHLVKPGGPVPETEKRGALVERVPTLGNSRTAAATRFPLLPV